MKNFYQMQGNPCTHGWASRVSVDESMLQAWQLSLAARRRLGKQSFGVSMTDERRPSIPWIRTCIRMEGDRCKLYQVEVKLWWDETNFFFWGKNQLRDWGLCQAKKRKKKKVCGS